MKAFNTLMANVLVFQPSEQTVEKRVCGLWNRLFLYWTAEKEELVH